MSKYIILRHSIKKYTNDFKLINKCCKYKNRNVFPSLIRANQIKKNILF